MALKNGAEGLMRALLALYEIPGANTMSPTQLEDMLERMWGPPAVDAEVSTEGAPVPKLMLHAGNLEGAGLDMWVARTVHLEPQLIDGVVHVVNPCTDGEAKPFQPSTEPTTAGLLVSQFWPELKPPAQPGDSFEAWVDRGRMYGGRNSGQPAVGVGPTWMVALGRAAVIATYGDVFDATDAQRLPRPSGSAPTVTFGQAKATVTP